MYWHTATNEKLPQNCSPILEYLFNSVSVATRVPWHAAHYTELDFIHSNTYVQGFVDKNFVGVGTE